jgi:hypothetical protein
MQVHLVVEDRVSDLHQPGHRRLVVGFRPREGEHPCVVQQVPVVLFHPVAEGRLLERPLGEFDDERVFSLCLPDRRALLEQAVAERHLTGTVFPDRYITSYYN